MNLTLESVVTVDSLYLTTGTHRPTYTFFDILVAVLCTVIIIVNLSVVSSNAFLLQRGQQPRATYIFLGNISLADLILGIVRLFATLYPHQLHCEFLCSFSIGLASAASLASVFIIVLIAIDRYLYILYGLHYHRYITTHRSHCMVLLTWIVSALFGFLPVLGWRKPMNGGVCCFISLIPSKIGLIIPSLGTIPMATILVLYGIILKNALNSQARLESMSVGSVQGRHQNDLRMFRGKEPITSNCADESLPSRFRSFGLPCCRMKILEITPQICENKGKAVKVVVYTTGAYFVTWFPYFVVFVLYAFSQESSQCENLAYWLSNPMALLAISNSLLNPVIYAWWHPGFRRSAKKMYAKLLVKVFPKQLSMSSSTGSRTMHPVCSMKQIEQDSFDSEKNVYYM